MSALVIIGCNAFSEGDDRTLVRPPGGQQTLKQEKVVAHVDVNGKVESFEVPHWAQPVKAVTRSTTQGQAELEITFRSSLPRSTADYLYVEVFLEGHGEPAKQIIYSHSNVEVQTRPVIAPREAAIVDSRGFKVERHLKPLTSGSSVTIPLDSTRITRGEQPWLIYVSYLPAQLARVQSGGAGEMWEATLIADFMEDVAASYVEPRRVAIKLLRN